MARMERRSFTEPHDVRTFEKGHVELVNIADSTVGRAIFKPGWQWSTSVKPIAKTNSCEAAHFQYHVAGTLQIRMDDGTEHTCRAGDVSYIPPGHDAWVVGDEPVVVVDFQGMRQYASGKSAASAVSSLKAKESLGVGGGKCC